MVYQDLIIGVDGSHLSVRSHIPHEPISEVKARRVEAQDREMREIEVRPRGLRVTLLRKPGPVTAPFFQSIGKE